MNKYVVKITKTCSIEVEAETREMAEQIARDQEADGCLSFDMEVEVRPVGIGGRTFPQWLRVLDNECNVSVYESELETGLFGFTGCDADIYESVEEAVEAAVTHYRLIEAEA
ncbi:hypothetical protein [Dechloromonas sp. ZS-1]|uniref:hypothetical protein n=1 Tax=Dechloromonas sp. ZS-1 TaxID=3138067 RepID=UPI0031FD9FB2